jgi:hypothetical protein
MILVDVGLGPFETLGPVAVCTGEQAVGVSCDREAVGAFGSRIAAVRS